MPFKSEAQRRYLWANEPKVAREWTEKYGSDVEKDESVSKKRKKGKNPSTQALGGY